MFERPRRASFEQLARRRHPLDELLVSVAQSEGQGLEPLAEGAETHHEEAGPRLPPHPDEGGEEAVDALGVDELADVEDQGRPVLRGEKGPDSLPKVLIWRAGFVGGGYLSEVIRQFPRALCAVHDLPKGRVLRRVAPWTARESLQDARVERVGPEEPGVHAAREGGGPVGEVGEVLGDGASAVGGERQDPPRPLEALAGEAHVLLTLAGDVLEATAVDDAHVWDASEGAA